MKRTAFITLLLLQMYSGSTQSVFSNATTSTLQKVLEDYPRNFKNIKGDILLTSSTAIDYTSTIAIPGSLRCYISQYGGKNAEAFSWICKLFESESFIAAEKRFKDLFDETRNTIIRIEGQKPYILNGQYASPREDMRNHSVFLHLLPSTGELHNVKVELKMTNENNSWKISLLVYGNSDKMQSLADIR